MGIRRVMWGMALIGIFAGFVVSTGVAQDRATTFPKLNQRYWVTTTDGMTNWVVTFIQHEADGWYRVSDGTGEYHLNLNNTVKLREIEPQRAEDPKG